MTQSKGTIGKKERRPILLFAGTTEGRRLAEDLLQTGWPVLVSVATGYGRELMEAERKGDACLTVLQGRLDEAQIGALIDNTGSGLVVDATHPYAALVTGNIRRACQERQGVCLLRCLREKGNREDREEGTAKMDRQGSFPVLSVPDLETAVRWLAGHSGNILAVTGSKELERYTHIPGYQERVYARVLPSVEAVDACRKLGFDGRHIIAMQGPFSAEMNLAQLREYNCRYLVTKDGGKAGGFSEKIEAAERAGVLAVVIERPKEDGLPLEKVKEQILAWIRREEERA